jgi:serine/threonine protein kinase
MQKIDTILGYEMRTLLGKGSFSEVYEARKGDKLVAIKLMKPPLTTDNRGLLDILRYEFWLLKDLTHPHIVRVFDFGQLEDGRFYLIEEYVAGVPLDVFCQRPFRDCEPIFTQILQGLAELESCGIVHGDIKPANILVTEIEKTPSAKILDFGMAHLKQKALFGGTPSTMAPEVILHQNSDHRSDLYSLGVTFYTCLSGKNPLLGKDVNLLEWVVHGGHTNLLISSTISGKVNKIPTTKRRPEGPTLSPE